eukprot:TRINITY_DN11088_c0_g1_i2.p1 TRINITY_DN11088_c0_g1~~TRINITY_DN11088_c0_g1_i2.p1  ORF type:complete len:521 (+),score=67.60 TRINITY_DN11088_c0_g1_i2:193-1755(+)
MATALDAETSMTCLEEGPATAIDDSNEGFDGVDRELPIRRRKSFMVALPIEKRSSVLVNVEANMSWERVSIWCVFWTLVTVAMMIAFPYYFPAKGTDDVAEAAMLSTQPPYYVICFSALLKPVVCALLFGPPTPRQAEEGEEWWMLKFLQTIQAFVFLAFFVQTAVCDAMHMHHAWCSDQSAAFWRRIVNLAVVLSSSPNLVSAASTVALTAVYQNRVAWVAAHGEASQDEFEIMRGTLSTLFVYYMWACYPYTWIAYALMCFAVPAAGCYPFFAASLAAMCVTAAFSLGPLLVRLSSWWYGEGKAQHAATLAEVATSDTGTVCLPSLQSPKPFWRPSVAYSPLQSPRELRLSPREPLVAEVPASPRLPPPSPRALTEAADGSPQNPRRRRRSTVCSAGTNSHALTVKQKRVVLAEVFREEAFLDMSRRDDAEVEALYVKESNAFVASGTPFHSWTQLFMMPVFLGLFPAVFVPVAARLYAGAGYTMALSRTLEERSTQAYLGQTLGSAAELVTLVWRLL